MAPIGTTIARENDKPIKINNKPKVSITTPIIGIIIVGRGNDLKNKL